MPPHPASRSHLPRSMGSPLFLGIKGSSKLVQGSYPELDSCDRIYLTSPSHEPLSFEGKPDDVGVISVNVATGEIHLAVDAKPLQPDEAKKGRLALGVINRIMSNRDAFLELH